MLVLMGWTVHDAYRLQDFLPTLESLTSTPPHLWRELYNSLKYITMATRQSANTTSLLRMILRLRRHFTLQLTLKRGPLRFTSRATERRPIPAPKTPPRRPMKFERGRSRPLNRHAWFHAGIAIKPRLAASRWCRCSISSREDAKGKKGRERMKGNVGEKYAGRA